MTRKVVDIESNDLLENMLDFSSLPYKLKRDAKLWCIVVRDIDTGEVVTLKSSGGNTISKEDVEKAFSGVSEVIAHNGIKFDFIAMQLFGVLDYEVGYLNRPDKLFGNDVKITDTLIRSRLFNPDRFGGHSLKAWGERLSEFKDDFREQSIVAGIIDKNSPKGEEFKYYSEIMVKYCEQDTLVTKLIHLELEKEFKSYAGWRKPEKLENKLADLAVRRESYGFSFNKELAVECIQDLTEKMETLASNVNPKLPPKPMGKTAIKDFTPPVNQFKKDCSLSSNMIKFANKHGATIEGGLFNYNGRLLEFPLTEPIETHEMATIADLDHVKMHLIDLGWNPTEFKVRDLTKDHKKQSIPYEKRVKALDTWLNQTFDEGKYQKHRLKELEMGKDKEVIRRKLLPKLSEDKPVRVPTSPCVRVGIEKELCPNLTKLGDKVDFAKDFTLYLTYKHRKSSIAGGDLEDMDFDDETPSSGFLSMYREVDGRIPTPSIEIGASTNRYRHIGVCNVARASSIYGKEMRSLFGCGKGMYQLGFDFSSLEARIQGHYILPFDGEELAEQLLASKPNDIHTINGKKLGIPRDQAKSVSYMLMYGGSASRAKTMLGITMQEAKVLVDNYWEAVKPLSNLRDAVTRKWKERGSKYVVGLDGRKIMTRSQHSLLNALFQSGGVIDAKYTTVFLYQILEEQGLRCNPFTEKTIDMCGMIEYHDECQLAVNPKLVELKTFDTEEDYKEFLSNWTGEQLGSETTLRNGKICIAMPNVVSKAITEAIKFAEVETRLKVPLGMEYVVANNWYNCH